MVHSLYLNQKPGDQEKLLSVIIGFISRVMVEKDLQSIAKDAIRTISEEFNMSEIVLGFWDENKKRFRFLGVHGYPPDVERKILADELTINWLSAPLPAKYYVHEDILYLSAESIWEYHNSKNKNPDLKELMQINNDAMIDYPEEAYNPRRSEDYWHELDYFEFVIRDNRGKPIGFLEINDSKDEMLPKIEDLLLISIFVRITGLALEGAKMRDKSEEISIRVDGLSTLLTKELDRSLRESIRTANMLSQGDPTDKVWTQSIDGLVNSIGNSISIIDKVSKLREIESKKGTILISTDPMNLMRKSISAAQLGHKNLKVELNVESKDNYFKCDQSLEDLFDIALETVISLRKSESPLIVTARKIKAAERAPEELDIFLSSEGIDTAGWRKLLLEMSSVESSLKRFSTSIETLSKYIMAFVARRYGGRIWVEEHKGAREGQKGALHITLPLIN